MADYYIGLMSGTSMDAIDAVLVDLQSQTPILIASHSQAISASLRERLLVLAEDRSTFSLDDYGTLDSELGVQFARAVLDLLDRARIPNTQVRAIGSHGQTVRHRPDGPNPFSLQIGDPNRIAALTGITTVADFRRRDLALGGQGAPLVPAFHHFCLRHQGESRVVLNLGGMANLTTLPQDPDAPVLGFDTGPGNVLLDAWHRQHRDAPFDEGGAWAASGTVIKPLLQQLLRHPFFAQEPPKSTGREQFCMAWLEEELARYSKSCEAVDVHATLAALTAESVAEAVGAHAAGCQTLLVCGGGVHNADLLARLTKALPKIKVSSTAEQGLDPDWVEAMAFAWLAQQTLAGQPGNLPSVTGASAACVLGGIYPA